MKFTSLPSEEIERRRRASIEAVKRLEQSAFEARYQEICDRRYWTRGQCCAGCDHWSSEGGNTGTCSAAGIMSGADVVRSMGVTFSSYVPPPGFPFRRIDFHCGMFRDNFDWSELTDDYLERIGAMRNGVLKPKPMHVAPCGE